MCARSIVLLLALALAACASLAPPQNADLGVVIERATGSIQVVSNTKRIALGRIDGLGDLSHASLVYSPDARHAFVFGRDGGLSKIDLTAQRVVGRIMQAGNSIGGAISKDGRIIAVANYDPGGVRLFDAATLAPLADIPATYGNDGRRAKVVGIADAPGDRFVFSLFDANEIWVIETNHPRQPLVRKYQGVGSQPYDGLITPDGRYYIAGLFGEDGLALLDLAHEERGVRRILDGYGRGTAKLPVYKMPHLRGWAMADRYAFLPAIGKHAVLVVDRLTWQPVTEIAVHGQPVFVMARPDGRQVWVNFAFPSNDAVQVIDVGSLAVIDTLRPGKTVLHMEFTAGGDEVWVSVRDDDRVIVYDTSQRTQRIALQATSPSGIFFTWRATRIGL